MLLSEAHFFARKKKKNKQTERKGELDMFTPEAIWIREDNAMINKSLEKK